MPDFVIKSRKKKEYEQFTCRIEIELLDKIRNIVVTNNLPSVNEFINDCLRFSMENLKVMENIDEEWIEHRWFRYYQPGLSNIDILINQIPTKYIEKKKRKLRWQEKKAAKQKAKEEAEKLENSSL